jgi:hypothetical protein
MLGAERIGETGENGKKVYLMILTTPILLLTFHKSI